MKKKNLISLLVLTGIYSCTAWATPDLFTNYSHYFAYEDKTFTTGLKTELSLAEGRFAINTNGNYNFGISVFSDNYLKKIPIKCQVGNLSIGGIVSKLNDPYIDSSPSGFGTAFSQPSIITSSLPSYSSFSKPLSCFLEGGWADENKIFREITINSAYTPETKDLSFSSKITLGFFDSFSVTNTSCFSFFLLEENKSFSWYLKVPYYKKTGTFCFASQILMELFNFSTNFSIFSYKSPFSGKNIIENIYKTENKFETDNFQIGISALFNNNRHIISRENKVLTPCTELKTNFQFNYNFGKNNDYAIKAGFTAYGKILAEQECEDDIKLGAATSLNFPLASVTLQGNFSYKYSESSKKMILRFFSGTVENLWKLKYISPELGLNCQYYISPESYNISQNYSIKLNFNAFNDFIINNNSFSFSVKENKICNKKIKTTISITFLYKKLLISGKIAGEFCI